jgi:polyhydroxyalkanoate synthesis regulator phasin
METRIWYDDQVDSQQWVPISLAFGGVQDQPGDGGYDDAELRALISNEETARIEGDNALDDRVTQNEADIAALQAESHFSGDYDDLTNKPDLSIYAETGDLATVAFTGSYNDLTDKPAGGSGYDDAELRGRIETLETQVADLQTALATCLKINQEYQAALVTLGTADGDIQPAMLESPVKFTVTS